MVVRELVPARRADEPPLEVDRGDGRLVELDVAGAAEDGAERVDDVGRVQEPGRHLVEERREQVVVARVDERDVDRAAGELARAGQAAEAAADDHDAGTRTGHAGSEDRLRGRARRLRRSLARRAAGPAEREVADVPGRRAAGVGRRDGLPARAAGARDAAGGARPRRLRLPPPGRPRRGVRLVRGGALGVDGRPGARPARARRDGRGHRDAATPHRAGGRGRHQPARVRAVLRRDPRARAHGRRGSARRAARVAGSSTSTRSSGRSPAAPARTSSATRTTRRVAPSPAPSSRRSPSWRSGTTSRSSRTRSTRRSPSRARRTRRSPRSARSRRDAGSRSPARRRRGTSPASSAPCS